MRAVTAFSSGFVAWTCAIISRGTSFLTTAAASCAAWAMLKERKLVFSPMGMPAIRTSETRANSNRTE
jgi:hypothetical protein